MENRLMNSIHAAGQHTVRRRDFLKWCAAGSGLVITSTQATAQTIFSEQMIEGPLYPDSMPLDTDNDLLLINDNRKTAAGEPARFCPNRASRSATPSLRSGKLTPMVTTSTAAAL